MEARELLGVLKKEAAEAEARVEALTKIVGRAVDEFSEECPPEWKPVVAAFEIDSSLDPEVTATFDAVGKVGEGWERLGWLLGLLSAAEEARCGREWEAKWEADRPERERREAEKHKEKRAKRRKR